MRKKILILFFIFINLVLSKDNDVIPFHNELSEVGKSIFGSIMGGTNVILNSKSYAREEFELYFKKYIHIQYSHWTKLIKQEKNLNKCLIEIILISIIQISTLN